MDAHHSTYILRNVTIEAIVAHKKDLVDIHCSAHVLDALSLMRSWNLTCVPVYGEPHGWIGSGFVNLVVNDKQYIGLVTIMDIFHYIYQTLNAPEIEQRMQSPVVNAVGSTIESRSFFLEPFTKSVLSTMEQFCKGTHYALAVNNEVPSSHPKMLSQTDIIGFLVDYAESLDDLRTFLENTSVKEYFSKSVAVVNINSPVSSIVPVLLTVNAAPVVNEANSPVSVVSVTELKALRNDELEMYRNISVGQLLTRSCGSTTLPSFHAEEESISLLKACRTMLVTKRRQVWIRHGPGDGDIGVITTTDIIRAAYHALK
jgi:CBS domain-containing protein